MNFGLNFDYFIYKICPPCIVFFGVIGNLFTISIFSRQRFKRGAQFFLAKTGRYLALNDIIPILLIIPYLGDAFANNILYLNAYVCKILAFILYFSVANSNWLIVIINIERLCSIRFKQFDFFKNKWAQHSIIALVYVWNFLVYCTRLYYTSLFAIDANSTNGSMSCDLEDQNKHQILNILDLFNSTLIPFAFMVICSIMIIITIQQTRKRTTVRKNATEMKRTKRDARFSALIIAMNTMFFIFNAPLCVYTVFGNQGDYIYNLLCVFFYGQYIVNILVYIFLNANFRLELLIMLRLKTKKKKATELKSFYDTRPVFSNQN